MGFWGFFCPHCLVPMFSWLLKHIFTGVTLFASMAQSSTPPSAFVKNLEQHNIFRKKHHSPPLIWNKTTASAASHWLQRCKFEHDPDRRLGENLYMIQHTPYTKVSYYATSAVKLWYREVIHHNYSAPVYSHFTQVVWKNTKQLGCAAKFCPIYGGKYLLISCKYYPPGNWIGQFKRNVLPP
jgi:uncharacterized protein YkwD